METLVRRYELKWLTLLLLFCFSVQLIRAQMNADTRTWEPATWFDSLYMYCGSLDEEVFDLYMLETYHGMTNELEKRKLYWEVQDGIWKPVNQGQLSDSLAERYLRAISPGTLLRIHAEQLAASEVTPESLRVLRQLYTIDKYKQQLRYIAVNHYPDDPEWNRYLEEFQKALELIGNRLDDDRMSDTDFSEINEICERMPVRLPSEPLEPGPFGAYYMKLRYYPDWDQKWRVGPDPDVVVRFPDDRHKFVFWRGTNYIPHWVTEKGFWFNNEFNETWFSEGSAEPMSDKQCRYSHVRIIQNSPARVIIHWRYALNDVRYEIAWPDDYTGWGDWSDEYYYIYPDATGTRKVILHTTHGQDDVRSTDEEGHEWQEGIVVYHPYTRPEDYLHLDAVHVANMKGESGHWSWEIPGEPTTPTPPGSNIVMMNMKSEMKPFIISPEGCRLAAYEGAQGGSHFRWRDHWPTTTEPTPGRNASGKQAAHGSFFHILEIPFYDRQPGQQTKVMLHGLTRYSVEGLVPLASSWLSPPPLEMTSGMTGIINNGYNLAEKAYVIALEEDRDKRDISFSLAAAKDTPAVNPAFVISGWDPSCLKVQLDGTELKAGTSFAWGVERDADQIRCIIWINQTLSEKSEIRFLNCHEE